MSRRLTVMTFAVLSALVLPSAAFARTATVTSFDGTKLHVNFFAAAGLHPGKRAPTVLMSPGWGSPGDTNAEDSAVPSLGAVGVGTLRRTGFNVLTWDPRGFGKSGGTVEVDSPRYEGRDVSALITWLARRPQAERAFFASRGPGALVGRITVPTLLIQGTADNLFTLQERSTTMTSRAGTASP